MHSAHCPRQQHPVVCEANDLDHAVRTYAINDDVPGTPNALFLGNKTAPTAEWVNPHARGCRYLLGAWAIGNGRQHGENRPHQQVVAFCRVNAESSCALEQNPVDVGFRAGEEPIAQRPSSTPSGVACQPCAQTSHGGMVERVAVLWRDDHRVAPCRQVSIRAPY